jgi:hypothetical protein
LRNCSRLPGQVSVGDLCKRYNLPSDFLQKEIEMRVGSTIKGKIDPADAGTIYTAAYQTRQASGTPLKTPATRPHSTSEALLLSSNRSHITHLVTDSYVGHRGGAAPNLLSSQHPNFQPPKFPRCGCHRGAATFAAPLAIQSEGRSHPPTGSSRRPPQTQLSLK